MVLFLPALVVVDEGLLNFLRQLLPFAGGRGCNISDGLLGVGEPKPGFLGLHVGDKGINWGFGPETHELLPHHLLHIVVGGKRVLG